MHLPFHLVFQHKSVQIVRLGAFALLVALLAGSSAHAQPTNLQQLKQCALMICDSVLLEHSPGDTVSLRVARHPADWLVEQAALDAAERRGVVVMPWRSDESLVITLAITALGVEYRDANSSDELERVAELSVSASMPDRASATRVSRNYGAVIVDTFEADLAPSLASSGYDFADTPVNVAKKRSFWDTVVEPVVVLGSAAVMVILLFTVRSQ